MSRPIPPAPPRPRARRLLAPIASLAACACAAAALVALAATVAPPTAAAAAAQPDLHRTHTGFPTLPVSTFSLPIGGNPTTTAATSQPPTSAPASSRNPVGVASSSAANGGGHRPKQTSSFVPQSLPAQAVPTSAGPCVPDTKAPASGADLQLPQVNAGSTDAGYAGWLKLSGVGPESMVPTQIDSSDLSTLTLTRTADAQSADLSMAASSGDRFACARLDVAAGPGYQRLDYALTNAGLVSETLTGKTETLIVTYSSISWNYLPTGSSTPKTGSGAINTRPDVASTSLKHDAALVGAGVVGLTVVCLLGMLLLTLVGRHRRKLRYREVRRRSRQPVAAKVPALVTAGAPSPEAPAAATAVLEPPESAAEPAQETEVPEALLTVHVAEFTHARPAKPAQPAPAEPAAEVDAEAEAEVEAEVQADVEADDDEAEAESEAETEVAAEVDQQDGDDAVTDPEDDAETDPDSAADADTESIADSESEPDSAADSDSESAADSESEAAEADA